MTEDELSSFHLTLISERDLLRANADKLDVASDKEQSRDLASDALAEAYFLRAFTSYESIIDRLFFHYLTGGRSRDGQQARSLLQPCSEETARRVVKGKSQFLSWAKPTALSEVASLFFTNGWPISNVLSAKQQELANCERVRNRIAHNSEEAKVQFNTVQRNLLGTERLFPLQPGHLLRIRHRKNRVLHLDHYMSVMEETIDAIVTPSP